MGEGSYSSVTESPSKTLDSTSRWTDEKHSSFLNSIEASFVNQLYSNQSCTQNFHGWLSRSRKRTHSSSLNENDLSSGQFKVFRDGRWENFRFHGVAVQADAKNDSLLFSSPLLRKSKMMDCKPYDVGHNECSNSSTQLLKQSIDGKAKFSKEPPPFSHTYLGDSVGCRTEVSDQNFVDDKLEVAGQSSRQCRKRSSSKRSNVKPIHDQIVPSGQAFVTPNLDDNYTCPDAEDTKSIYKELQSSARIKSDAGVSGFKGQDECLDLFQSMK